MDKKTKEFIKKENEKFIRKYYSPKGRKNSIRGFG